MDPSRVFQKHFRHPKSVRPNGEVVVLSAEGVEEKEAETDGSEIEEFNEEIPEVKRERQRASAAMFAF